MPDRDPMLDLRDLAEAGERDAHPLPAGRVRELGDQRRRRRHVAMAVGALAVTLITGGVVIGATGVLQTSERIPPPIAGSPVPSGSGTAAPTRTLSEANLLRASDVPVQDTSITAVIAEPNGKERPRDQISICLPEAGIDDLGATAVLERNFRYQVADADVTPDPNDPLRNEPTIYTQALQFADEAAATKAYETYRGWLDGCAAIDQQQTPQRIGDLGFEPTDLTIPGATATVAEVVYRLPPDIDRDEAFWESTALTLVGDRMMVTVYLHYATEWYGTLEPAAGGFEHPQVGLAEASAKRLTE